VAAVGAPLRGLGAVAARLPPPVDTTAGCRRAAAVGDGGLALLAVGMLFLHVPNRDPGAQGEGGLALAGEPLLVGVVAVDHHAEVGAEGGERLLGGALAREGGPLADDGDAVRVQLRVVLS
jgi:hypothetical protein